MDFADAHHFNMAANFHGGAEVVNYPWDTWYTRHADTDWWELVSRQFADTAHVYSPNGYLTDLDNGVSNGYDWYSISGGRQDYMNYFHHCREVTLEVSNVKLPPASQLPAFWEYLHRSCLNYMEQVLYGFRGTITDASNGNPIFAEVFVNNHDEENDFKLYQAINLLSPGRKFPSKDTVIYSSVNPNLTSPSASVSCSGFTPKGLMTNFPPDFASRRVSNTRLHPTGQWLQSEATGFISHGLALKRKSAVSFNLLKYYEHLVLNMIILIFSFHQKEQPLQRLFFFYIDRVSSNWFIPFH